MLKSLYILFCLSLISISGFASDTLVSLSGSTLTGFSGIKQDAESNPFRGQFESAANVVFHLDHGDEIKLKVDLALASLVNESGFGLSMLVFDLNYTPNQFKNLEFNFGFNPIPFGQFAEAQTNNSKINSSFIYNDLGYALLTKNSNVLQFRSNGVKATYSSDYGSVESMVFNGTDGYDTNPDKGFGVALRYLNDIIVPNSTVSVSYLNSNDAGNVNAINGNTTGYIADFKTDIYNIEFGGYFASLTLDDYNSSTKDGVSSYMVYTSKNFGNYTIAARYSAVSPEDYDGNGEDVTSALMPLGLSNIAITDLDVSRIQVAGILHLSKSLNLHNEVVYDIYADDFDGYNNIGFLSYASLNF